MKGTENKNMPTWVGDKNVKFREWHADLLVSFIFD